MDGLGAVWHFIELAMINPLSLSLYPPLPVSLSLSLALSLSLFLFLSLAFSLSHIHSYIHTYMQSKGICHRYEDKELSRWMEEDL